MSVRMRSCVLLLAAAVCLALLLSCALTASAAGHTCGHEDCEICCVVSSCRETLRSLSTVIVLLALFSGAVCIFYGASSIIPVGLFCPTLIVNKVKLSI